MGYIIKIFKWNVNLKSITVEPIMFLYMFTTFLQNITLQAMVYEKVCQQTYNQTVCDDLTNVTFRSEENDVQKRTSTWVLYLNIAVTVPALFSVILFLGPLGDRVGRKVPIVFPLIGGVIFSTSNLLNAYFIEASPVFLLVGTFLNGLIGGAVAALMTMYTYIAHISTMKHKTVRMGILQSMIFLSATLSTALSGVILDHTSYLFVFSLLVGIMILSLLYAVIWLENVKVVEDSTSEKQSTANNGWCQLAFSVIKDVLLWLNDKRKDMKSFVPLLLLIFLLFCLNLVTVGQMDIILMYTRYQPFNWSQTILGFFSGTETFLRGLAVLTLLPLLKVRFHVRDTIIIMLGLSSKIALLVIIGLAQRTEVMFIGAVAGILEGFSASAIRSVSSNMLPPNEQAKLFSFIGLIEVIAQLLATSIFNTLYKATLDFLPGFCFLMAAGIIGLCVFVAIYLHITLPRTMKIAGGIYDTLENDEEIIVNADAADDITVNTENINVNADVTNGEEIA